MTIRRFRVNVEGLGDLVGLVFDRGEPELEAFLTGRSVPDRPYVTTTAGTSEDEQPRPVGRPSFDSLLDQIVTRLAPEIGACNSLRSAARLVQRTLAADLDADMIPSLSTVERFITRARQNQQQKPQQNSTRARMAGTGGDQ